MRQFKINGINYKCHERFRFAAMNADGEVYAYTQMPNMVSKSWMPRTFKCQSTLLKPDQEISAWKDSMIMLPHCDNRETTKSFENIFVS